MTSGKIWKDCLVCTAFLFALIFVYTGRLDAPFLFDDHDAVRDNPSIRRLWPVSVPLSTPTEIPVAGRPLVNLSFALNYRINGLNPWGYRAVNLAIHWSCACLVFLIARRTIASIHQTAIHSWESGSVSFVIALIWALHPIQAETVLYITQRTESLSSLLALGSLYAAIRSWEAPNAIVWKTTAVVFCALAMLTKESAATIPVLVFLYDRAFLADSWRGLFEKRDRFYLALFSTWIILAGVLLTSPRGGSVGFHLGVSALEYLQTQCWMLSHYLCQLVWPKGLRTDYGIDPILDSGHVFPGAAIAFCFIGLAVWLWFRRPEWGYALVWFLVLVAPSSSFVPIVTEIGAERRVYLASIGPIAISTFVLWNALSLIPSSRRKFVGGVACALVIASLATVSIVRAGSYASRAAFWCDAISKNPENARAYQNLANVLGEEFPNQAQRLYRNAIALSERIDRPAQHLATAMSYSTLGVLLAGQEQCEQGLKMCRKADQMQSANVSIRINLAVALAHCKQLAEAKGLLSEIVIREPENTLALLNLARILRATGRSEEAKTLLETALAQNPSLRDLPEISQLVAGILRGSGDPDDFVQSARQLALVGKTSEAIEKLKSGLADDPSNAQAYSELGRIAGDSGQLEVASQYCRKAVELKPNSGEFLAELALVLAKQQQFTEAFSRFNRAVQLSPQSSLVYMKLATAQRLAGKKEEAITNLEKAVALDGNSATAMNSLGAMLVSRDPERAITLYRKALMIAPDYPDAHNNLANALARRGDFDEAIEHYQRAIAIRPNYAQAIKNLAIVQRMAAEAGQGR